MDKNERTKWVKGWRMIDGHPSLTKPAPPHPAIVRLVLNAAVVNLEVKKPSRERIAGGAYGKIEADSETGFPRGLGVDTITGFTKLMEDNKYRAVFAPKAGREG